MKESKFKEELVKSFKAKWPDCFIYKTQGGYWQKQGLPDLIASVKGLYVALECKVWPRKFVEPESMMTPIQRRTLQQIEDSGARAYEVIYWPEADICWIFRPSGDLSCRIGEERRIWNVAVILM